MSGGAEALYCASGATEGAILGIPSIAVSLGTFEKPDYIYAAKFAKKIVKLIIENKGLPHGTLLNINIPAVPQDQIKGVRNFADPADAPADTHVPAWHFRRFQLPQSVSLL